MTRQTRPISWIRAALKEFEKFPEGAKSVCLTALTIAAEGGKADIAKPVHGGIWYIRDRVAVQERCLSSGICGAVC
jgi:phage-related protein